MIPPESIPGRISLIATQCLTLTNIFIYQLSNSPSGTQLNAMEIYILVSLFFVLATIIEFGVILVLKRVRVLDRKPIKVDNFENHQSIPTIKVSTFKGANSEEEVFNSSLKRKSVSNHEGYSTSEKIDLTSFFTFAFAYILLNCIYSALYAC